MADFSVIFIFLFSIAVGFIILLLGRVDLGLLFLVPLFPLRNVVENLHQMPFGKDLIDIILIAMLVGWVIKAVSNRNKIIEFSPFNKLILFLFITTYISLWRGSFYLELPAPISFTTTVAKTQVANPKPRPLRNLLSAFL